MLKSASSYLILLGVLAVIVGIIALAWPGVTVLALVILFAIDAFLGAGLGFWSGFGSDLEEFGILGAIGAAVYQLVKKYNCHEPGCWRIGQHPAAGGQFMLCYRHHPDYQGRKPTHEMIQRLHREHLERQEAIRDRLHEAQHRTARPAAANEAHTGNG